MRLISLVTLVILGTLIAGCADPNIKPTHVEFGERSGTDAITMGPTLRMISERPRSIDGGVPVATQCSEPSPDAVIAFSRSLQGQGSYAETGGPTISGNFTASANEAATQLAGRNAGVLALRDGLFAACQAYVNGVLGHDAYALILSQYGNLLVALAGQQTAGAPAAYTAQESMALGLMVACISENDPTRIRPILASGGPDINPLLNPKVCASLLKQIASGTLLKATKAKVASVSPPAKAGTQQVTKTSITKTVTKNSGPAPASAAGGAAGAGGGAGAGAGAAQ